MVLAMSSILAADSECPFSFRARNATFSSVSAWRRSYLEQAMLQAKGHYSKLCCKP